MDAVECQFVSPSFANDLWMKCNKWSNKSWLVRLLGHDKWEAGLKSKQRCVIARLHESHKSWLTDLSEMRFVKRRFESITHRIHSDQARLGMSNEWSSDRKTKLRKGRQINSRNSEVWCMLSDQTPQPDVFKHMAGRCIYSADIRLSRIQREFQIIRLLI